MKRHLATSLAFAAAVMTALPFPVLAQQSTAPTANARKARSADIRLEADGSLKGRLINSSGKVIENAQIKMLDGEKLTATVTTDADGRFTVANATPGPKTFVTPQGAQSVRLWKSTAAPPTSLSELNLIAVDPAVRGQMGILQGGTLGTILGVTGVVLAGISVSKLNDLEDDVSTLQSTVNAIATP